MNFEDQLNALIFFHLQEYSPQARSYFKPLSRTILQRNASLHPRGFKKALSSRRSTIVALNTAL
jgi:hypothetical protein